MLKRALLFILPLLLALPALAQQNKVREAVEALQNKDLDRAIAIIDSASAHPETKDVATTWYYRGFIYKDLYNKREKANPQSPARLVAIESFKKFLKLDTEGELTESNNKSLKYLATTLYNDAATNLNPSGYEEAIKNYERYKETIHVLDPGKNFRERDSQFNLVVASVFTQMYEADRKGQKPLFNKIKNIYEEELRYDSLNVSANYNMGILYYNEAVHIIKALDYETDLIMLEQIQEECVELFRKSLPYMQLAYELNPKRKETLIGLAGIYFSLNEMDKSEDVQNELKLLDEKD